MATKIKKISINALEKCLAEITDDVSTFEWRGIEISVRRRLSLQQMLLFVTNVTSLCFTDEGEYIPEVKDFAIRSNMLEVYANFTLPQNAEKKYEMVMKCDIFPLIYERIDGNQFKDILWSIDEKLDYVASSHIEAITKQIEDIYSAFNGLEEKMSTIFEGMDKETFNAIANALTQSGVDEEKLMTAYINAKSDKQEDEDESEGD